MTARTKSLTAALAGVGAAALLVIPAAGQAPTTSWGAPDLRGTWDFRSITPFERPASFKDQEFLTPDEVEAFEEAVRTSREERAANSGYTENQSDVDVGYNSFFIDSGTRMSGTMRTSMVVDPPDGRLPATAETQRRQQPTQVIDPPLGGVVPALRDAHELQQGRPAARAGPDQGGRPVAAAVRPAARQPGAAGVRSRGRPRGTPPRRPGRPGGDRRGRRGATTRGCGAGTLVARNKSALPYSGTVQ